MAPRKPAIVVVPPPHAVFVHYAWFWLVVVAARRIRFSHFAVVRNEYLACIRFDVGVHRRSPLWASRYDGVRGVYRYRLEISDAGSIAAQEKNSNLVGCRCYRLRYSRIHR